MYVAFKNTHNFYCFVEQEAYHSVSILFFLIALTLIESGFVTFTHLILHFVVCFLCPYNVVHMFYCTCGGGGGGGGGGISNCRVRNIWQITM